MVLRLCYGKSGTVIGHTRCSVLTSTMRLPGGWGNLSDNVEVRGTVHGTVLGVEYDFQVCTGGLNIISGTPLPAYALPTRCPLPPYAMCSTDQAYAATLFPYARPVMTWRMLIRYRPTRCAVLT
eukprot:1754519-Rhodomonas_salina.1